MVTNYLIKEEFEDTRAVIRICKSVKKNNKKKDRQHDGQKKKDKMTNKYLQNITGTHKSKDRVTRTPLRTGGELRCTGRGNSSCSSSGTLSLKLL